MNADPYLVSFHLVKLFFGNIVTYVVEEFHPQVLRADGKGGKKGLSSQVHEDLTICPGVIGSTGHACQISASNIRL
jgi:hypothetical protein